MLLDFLSVKVANTGTEYAPARLFDEQFDQDEVPLPIFSQLSKFLKREDPEAEPAHRDLHLGANEALSGLGRNQEGTAGADCIKPQNSLQHERRVHSRIDCRVRTGEEQLQALVGIVRLDCGLG
jgi:hypothetical protein